MTSIPIPNYAYRCSNEVLRMKPAPPSILLITPPLVQTNTPYPAVPVLAAALRARGLESVQVDLSLDLVLSLFTGSFLRRAQHQLLQAGRRSAERRAPAVAHFLEQADAYIRVVDDVVAFQQGRHPELAYRIATRSFLPEGSRFEPLDQLGLDADIAGPLAVVDRARHFASLMLDDLADMIRDGIDPRFGFSRYAETLAVALPTFAPLARAMRQAPTLVTQELDRLVDEQIGPPGPLLVAMTVPFPGCLLGAMLIARRIRERAPEVRIVLGGGYVNTELRELTDPAIFDWVDYICLDDGEEPLIRIAEHVCHGKPFEPLRTYWREKRQVIYHAGTPGGGNFGQSHALHPDFQSIDLDRYLPLAESINPMHRLWSDGCWLKVQLTHGCYWRRCRFCDTSVDYISRYVAPTPAAVVDHLVALRRETGRQAFHFTDEALAPAWIGKVAVELLERSENPVWWGNIRFEKEFTPELACLMAASGCVAVTGGLECVNDRLLKLMNKGVTLAQAEACCEAFASAGILVHAYLIYGFPTQTRAETLEALDFVRGLFARGLLHSAFWHRFALTCHSPMARTPEAFGIRLAPDPSPRRRFARNAIPYTSSGRTPDHDALGAGLRRATYNYMLGRGTDWPVKRWFP